MGISSTGILAFGFDLGIEDQRPDFLGEDHEDFDDWVAEKGGMEPWSENAAKDFFERKNKIIAACPVELIGHCSYDYPMYVLAIRGCEKRATRGYPEKLEPNDFIVAPEKITAAKAWCEENGIEWQEPAWILCSIYG